MKIKTLAWAIVFGGFLAALPLQVPAQTRGGGLPQFIPASGWNVSATSLSQMRGLSSIKLPCMMMSTYNNGFIVRLSGGGGNLLAMAIDFRQNIFVQGRKYDATVSLDDSYVERTRATAFSDSVLIFNLREFSGFYNGIRNAQNFTLDVEDNAMRFALANVSEGLQRLEACYTGKKPSSPAAPQEVSAQPMGQAMGVPPQSPQVSNWEDKVSPMPSETRTPRSPPGYEKTHSIWTASAGDDLQATLQSWAGKAGVAVDWQANNSGKVADDIRVTGTFEEAVQTLMAQNATAFGLEASLMGGGASSAPQPLMPTHVNTRVSRPVDSTYDMSTNAMSPAQWTAPAGASLSQVLSTWTSQAGVEFVWRANETFTVRRAISANGSFESALQSLLGQFTNDNVRPAAHLNNDPVTGRRILFVESSRVL